MRESATARTARFYIRELMEKRRSRYESVADLAVATDGRSAETIADEIIAKLREA